MTTNCLNAEDIDLSTQILCPCCKNVYVEPLSLPCGKTICKEHVNESLITKNNKKIFKCLLCKVDHQTDAYGHFPMNERIENLAKKCQVRATPIKEIHKTANESYNKLTSIIYFLLSLFIIT